MIGGNFSTVTDPNTTVTNATAVSGAVSAGVTTAMSTAKAVSASVTTSGTITDAYGLYVDTIQGSNKWAVYATDATTPSFFAGNVGVGTTAPVGGMSVMNGNVGIGTWSPRGALEVKGTGSAQITINGASGGCLMFRDTDNSGWTECNALNGVLTCSVDADGICDGS